MLIEVHVSDPSSTSIYTKWVSEDEFKLVLREGETQVAIYMDAEIGQDVLESLQAGLGQP